MADGVVPDPDLGQNGYFFLDTFFLLNTVPREHYVDRKLNESVIKMTISTVLLGNNDFSFNFKNMVRGI